MSDVSQGAGWWQASDGKWYPPEQHPSYQPPPPPPPSSAAPTDRVEPITAKGVNGTVSFDGRMVTITHSGVLGRMTAGKGEKRIPVSSIAGVEWKPPGLGVRGFLRLTVPGGIERTSRVGKRTQDAAKDENSIVFGKTQLADFERVRTAIEDAIAAR